MNPDNQTPESTIMQFILGKWISKPIYAVSKLGIPDILGNKSIKVEELAELTATDSKSLYRLLRALSGLGIFREISPFVFCNTDLSRCLMKTKLQSASLMFHSEWHDKMWDNILYTVNTGKSAFENVHGQPAFEWFKENPEQGELFQKANSFKAKSLHKAIVNAYDFSNANLIIDVGGGTGSLLIEIIKQNQNARGIIAELSENIALADQNIKNHDLKKKVTAVECNFFKNIPSGGSIYILSNILHDWPDKECIKILKNCKRVMKKESRLIVLEALILPGNEFCVGKLLDIEVLLMGNGKERTKDEFSYIFKKAGLKILNTTGLNEAMSLIEMALL